MDYNTPLEEKLIRLYETNGLFATIIDTPADEALRTGFTIEGIKDRSIVDYCMDELEYLGWEDLAADAIRWSRLLGGALAVLLVNDGRGIDEPLDIKNARSIDAIRLYDCSLVQPNTVIHPNATPETTEPEYFNVFSKYGTFRVHASRCLIFRNSVLPENTPSAQYKLWGIPEYTRISQALLNTELAYSHSFRLLNAAGQGLYKMKDLGAKSATEEGCAQIKRQLELVDLTRGMLNSIAIDRDEQYHSAPISFSGVAEVVSAAEMHLIAVTRIPPNILFGKKTINLYKHDTGATEKWYNYVEQIRNRTIKHNLYRLLSIILQVGYNNLTISNCPSFKIHFSSLWLQPNLGKKYHQENKTIAYVKAMKQLAIARKEGIYVRMGAMTPAEVRRGLAKDSDFDIAALIDKEDILT